MANRSLEEVNFVPGLAPVDIATSAAPTQWIDMANAHRVSFLAIFGAATASAADTVTMTIEVSSAAASGAENAVPFTYRLSGAVGTNTWTAPAAATSAGYAPLQTAAAGVLVYAELDPAVALAYKSDARYVRFTALAQGTAIIMGSVAMLEPRFRQVTMISAATA